jgi:hypothetical protein
MPGEGGTEVDRRAGVTTARSLLRLAAIAAALSAGRAHAQAVPCAAGDSARADTAGAAVRILASVTIAELRFDSRPRAAVRTTGCGGSSPVRVIERRNLPDRVEPGVTYRDVYVAVEILGRVEAACLSALAADAALAGICGAAAEDSARAPPRP